MKRFLIPMMFIACNSYAAGIQKWTDESGNIHYGDAPPIKTKTESVRVSRPPSNPGKPLPRLTTGDSADGSQQKTTGTKVEQKKQDRTTEEVNKQVCEKTKESLKVISSNSLIRLKLSDGTERALSDEEIDERRLKLEQDVKQYCK